MIYPIWYVSIAKINTNKKHFYNYALNISNLIHNIHCTHTHIYIYIFLSNTELLIPVAL